ncbi:hypothetical protein [Novosphingobium nitrogenifigens]|uniref:hypothetical protein n=1 Tax=Novosphingobium nitrogenifigens TaxID=378548 RepID=UPI0012F4A81F|nr:hypothetical protein [Novosphingobium nitrogenifigens]
MTIPVFTRLRTVIESAQVSSAVDAAVDVYSRFDDAWEGFKWLLARKASSLGEAPRDGDHGLRLYAQGGDADADAPEIWALFRVEAESVELIAVRFSKAFDDE